MILPCSIVKANDFLAIDGDPSFYVSQANTIFEAMPPVVQKLFIWPDKEVLQGKKRADSSSNEVLHAKNSSWEWMKDVLDPGWLPPPNTEMIFLRNEFEFTAKVSKGEPVNYHVDTSRIRWEQNEYTIEVSQLSKVFAIKFTPQHNRDTGRDKQSRYDYAKEVCKNAFCQRGKMVKAIPDFKDKLISFTFDPAKMRELPGDKAVVGNPKSMNDEGVDISSFSSKDGFLFFYQKDGETHIEKSLFQPVAWTYWFRQIHWWNDGKAVGFYFLKLSGPADAWVPSFSDHVNENWIIPLSERKEKED
jgi:hypothetical protein